MFNSYHKCKESTKKAFKKIKTIRKVKVSIVRYTSVRQFSDMLAGEHEKKIGWIEDIKACTKLT